MGSRINRDGTRIETAGATNPSPSVKFSIKHTEFLIRLVSSSQINGHDLEIAMDTKEKLLAVHNKLMAKTESI